MRHAGLPTDINWCNQDAVAIGKIAQVVSLKLFHFINYSLLHIAKTISRNKHLKCCKWNWATIEIMKTLHSNTLSLSQGLSCWIIQIPGTSSWRVLAWPVQWLESCWSPYFIQLWRLKPSQLQGVFSSIYQECCSKQVCLDLFCYQIH